MSKTSVELYPFRRALTYHKKESSSVGAQPGAVIMSAEHIAAISELAEAKLEHYGLPDDLRAGARFKYYTGPLDYQQTIVATVSEVLLVRDAEKWALESLSLSQVPRRFFYKGQIIATKAQNDHVFHVVQRHISSSGCSI
jgi:hypothetical protein